MNSIRTAFHLHDAHGAFTGAALLLSDQNPFAVKCAVFAGDTKTQAYGPRRDPRLRAAPDQRCRAFLTLHNIDGQWPEAALHESLVNAVLHRDYEYSGPILVNVFSNRIEIVSLGGLVRGLQINDLLNGICQPRNAWLVLTIHSAGNRRELWHGHPAHHGRIRHQLGQPAVARRAILRGDGPPPCRCSTTSRGMIWTNEHDMSGAKDADTTHGSGDGADKSEPAAKRYVIPRASALHHAGSRAGLWSAPE
jgi:hypothetical protein